jgi:hypothetical protein
MPAFAVTRLTADIWKPGADDPSRDLRAIAQETSMSFPHSPLSESGNQPTGSEPPSSKTLKFSKKRLALAFAVAGVSDVIGAFVTLAPPIVWVVDLGTALLLFMVLGRQWLLLPGLALEAFPGLGVLPFWLLVVGAIAVLGTPRPKFEQH